MISGKRGIVILFMIVASLAAPQIPMPISHSHKDAAKFGESTPEVPTSETLAASGPSSVNMTTLGQGWETTVAVNPINPSSIMVTPGHPFGLVNDSSEVARISSDGGKTWRIGTATYTACCYDMVGSYDASGDPYFGTVDVGQGPAMSYLFKSTDGGNSFSLTGPFLKLNDSLIDYRSGSVVQPCATGRDYPGIIADQYPNSPYRNDLYVWDYIDAGPNCFGGPAFQRSTDGGKTWDSGMFYQSGGFHSANRGMAVAPDGTVLLAGTSYSAPACGTSIEPTPVILKSTDGGLSFSQLCVPSNINVNPIEVAASSANDLYVVFQNGNNLYCEVSHDGGVKWSAPAIINDAPEVAMWDFSLSHQTGRLDVAWIDYRNNGGNNTLADIYYSYSYDGSSWAANLRVTTQGPYYYASIGNDYMWITSVHTSSSDDAYIGASIGATACGNQCIDRTLYTRFVRLIFPLYRLTLQGYDYDGAGEENLTLNGNHLASLPIVDSPQNSGVNATFSLNITSLIVPGFNTLTFTHAIWDCGTIDWTSNVEITNSTGDSIFSDPTSHPLSCTQSITFTFTLGSSPSVGGREVPIDRLSSMAPYIAAIAMIVGTGLVMETLFRKPKAKRRLGIE